MNFYVIVWASHRKSNCCDFPLVTSKSCFFDVISKCLFMSIRIGSTCCLFSLCYDPQNDTIFEFILLMRDIHASVISTNNKLSFRKQSTFRGEFFIVTYCVIA